MSEAQKKHDNNNSSTTKRRRSQPEISSDSSESEEQDDRGSDEEVGPEYDVEKIVARKVIKRTGKFQYLIKWTGYPDTANTWEPEHRLTKCANWVVDFNRAEDGMLKFNKLQDMVTLLLSVSKAPPAAIAGVDITGSGVVVPGTEEPATTNGNEMTMNEEPEEINIGLEENAEEEQCQVPADYVAKPVGAPNLGTDVNNPKNVSGSVNLTQGADDDESAIALAMSNVEDPIEGQAVVLGVQSKENDNGPVIISTCSIPQADIFHSNQNLVKQIKFLQSQLAEKDKEVKEVQIKLKTVKESRALLETKLAHERNDLKIALREIAQHKKDFTTNSDEKALLESQLKGARRENEQLVESLNEKEVIISTLQQEVQSIETVNDKFQDKMFQQQETIGTLATNQAALTTERDRLVERLAKEQGRVSVLERDLGGVRTLSEQRKDNLMSMDVIITSLKRELEHLQTKREQQNPTTRKELESQYEQQLGKMEDAWNATLAENARLKLKVDELTRELSICQDNRREDSLDEISE